MLDIDETNEATSSLQYQDYSVSIDSYSSSAKSPNSPSQLLNFNNQVQTQINQLSPYFYMNEKYQDNKNTSQYTPTPRIIQSIETNSSHSISSNIRDDVNHRPSPQPPPPRPPSYNPGIKITTETQELFKTYKQIEAIKSAKSPKILAIVAPPITRPLNVDDFLDKVMNDVINDFDNVKFKKYSNNNNHNQR